MIYSHFYDLIAKVILFAAAIGISFQIGDHDTLKMNLIQQFNLKESQSEFTIFLMICALLVILWFILYLPLLSPLASWFYVRFTLKTPITWAMAKDLAPLLRPSFTTMKWYDMKPIKYLPKENRVKALHEILNHLKK